MLFSSKTNERDKQPEIMDQPDIDGALVGGASLDPEEFALIVRYDSNPPKSTVA